MTQQVVRWNEMILPEAPVFTESYEVRMPVGSLRALLDLLCRTTKAEFCNKMAQSTDMSPREIGEAYYWLASLREYLQRQGLQSSKAKAEHPRHAEPPRHAETRQIIREEIANGLPVSDVRGLIKQGALHATDMADLDAVLAEDGDTRHVRLN